MYDEKTPAHMMTVSATLAIATYMLYTVSPETIERVGHRWMFLTVLPVIYAVFRFYRPGRRRTGDGAGGDGPARPGVRYCAGRVGRHGGDHALCGARPMNDRCEFAESGSAAPRGVGPGWLWAAGVLAALTLYMATLAPDLVWQDAGDYQFQAARLNLSRPGDAVRVHPLFLVVAHALGYIPLWNYAYAANLASALGAAVAVGNVLVLVRLVTGRTWPAVLAATMLAVGHGLWAYATIAQTYGWAAAVFPAWSSVRGCGRPGGKSGGCWPSRWWVGWACRTT